MSNHFVIIGFSLSLKITGHEAKLKTENASSNDICKFQPLPDFRHDKIISESEKAKKNLRQAKEARTPQNGIEAVPA